MPNHLPCSSATLNPNPFPLHATSTSPAPTAHRRSQPPAVMYLEVAVGVALPRRPRLHQFRVGGTLGGECHPTLFETHFEALAATFFTCLENDFLFFHLSGGGSCTDESAVHVISLGFNSANAVACSSPAWVVGLVDRIIMRKHGRMEKDN